MRVWKHVLKVTDVQELQVPRGAQFLPYIGQYQTITPWEHYFSVWTYADPMKETCLRKFFVVGTGNPAPDPSEATYVGSVENQALVWHVFVGPEC